MAAMNTKGASLLVLEWRRLFANTGSGIPGAS